MSNNNTFICKVYNQTFLNVDEFRCNITKLAAAAFYLNFGYICFGLIFVIILISVFGKIKENYRWFILNQSIWDILLCYNFSCSNYFYPTNKCIWINNISVMVIIESIIFAIPYSASFLLSASRFLALYFTNLYANLTKPKTLVLIFFIFYLFALFFCCCSGIFYYQYVFGKIEARFECTKTQNKSYSFCTNLVNSEIKYAIYLKIFMASIIFTTLIPSFSLLLSVFASILIILRLIKQAKFQWKHQRKDLHNSARICTVIFLQCFLNFFILSLQFLGPQLDWIFLVATELFQIQILSANRKYGESSPEKIILHFYLPLWLSGDWGLASFDALQLILQFRIFVESFIILFVMTGYREALWKFLKYLFFAIKNPKKFWNEIFYNKTTSVIILSTSR